MKRALTPATNPTGLGSAAAAIYAAVVMVWNATHHHGVIDPQVIVAALGAAAFLYARFKVTPVADPKDGNGQPLVAAAPSTAITVNAAGAVPAEIGRQVVAAMRRGGYMAGGTAVSDLPPPPPSVTTAPTPMPPGGTP